MAREAVEDDGDSREAPRLRGRTWIAHRRYRSVGGRPRVARTLLHSPPGRHRHGVRGPAAPVAGLQEPDGRAAVAPHPDADPAGRARHAGRAEHGLSAAADEGDDHPAAPAAAERPGSAARAGAADRPVPPLARAGRSASARSRSILSGSGSDGSRGIQEVSQAGGVVFCESPDTAQFNGMPLSAIATGNVDQVLPPEEIAAAIAALGRQRSGGACDGRGPASEDRGVDAILRLLRDEYAIDFSHYKASTVTRRIERRLALNRSLDIDMLRRAAAQRSARAELALRGSADRRDAVLPRRRRVRGAGAADHSGDRRAQPARTIRSASGSPAARPARRRTRSRCCCTSG